MRRSDETESVIRKTNEKYFLNNDMIYPLVLHLKVSL